MLYAHDPASLLPLLRSYLPYSISIVASILANTDCHNGDTDTDDSTSNPSPNANANANPTPLDAVYTTFPPSSLPNLSSRTSLPNPASPASATSATSPTSPTSPTALPTPPTPWLATLAIPEPYTQTRTFHTLESLPASEHTADAYADAQAMVVAAWGEMARIYPLHLKGAVHALWGQAVRGAMAGVDRGLFTVYYATEEEGGGGEGQWGAKAGSEGETCLDGLVLDHGRAGDEQLFYKHNQYRTPEFYASRLDDTTVLRPRRDSTSPRPPPVAWIVTLTDGSQGTLFTLPSHRRRGLAKIVVAARIRACRERARARSGGGGVGGGDGGEGGGEGGEGGQGQDGGPEWLGWPGSYAAVAPGNTASEALWTTVGWVRGWDVTYVMRGEALAGHAEHA